MLWKRIGLAAALLLYAGWTGWLIYQSATSTSTIVVSRPQIFMAPIVVEASVPEGSNEREVQVTHVYRGQEMLGIPANQSEPKNLKVTVTNFGEARGWRGPGKYILPLQKADVVGDKLELVPLPPSPGFPPLKHPERVNPAIYPVTESTREQVREALQLK
jgi:hypothetical protein